jgi:4-amino-4-deoxy-L-arabinose transferase-like glycosyltransferase
MASRPTTPRARTLIVSLLLAGLLPRLAAILTVGDVPEPHGDEHYYVSAAQALARGEGHPGSVRPPGFPLFLAAVLKLTGGGLTALRIAQIPLALLAMVIVFDLVDRRFGPRPALVSALLVAWSPDLVHYTHFLWSETLLAALLLLAVWALDRHDREPSLRWVVVAALALGAAALTREMAVFLLPAAVVWLVLGQSGPRRRSAAVVLSLVTVACVVPWTLRNYRLHGRFVLISTNRWYPIAEGNLLAEGDPVLATERVRELRRRYLGNPDEISREAAARDIARQAIREAQPWWIARKAVLTACLVFAPSRSQLGRFLEQGWIRPRWQPAAAKLRRLEAPVYGAAMLVSLTALWLVPDPRLKWLAVSFLLVFLAVYLVGNAAHRFRVPLLPLLGLYAGPLLCGRGVTSAPRVAGAALTLAAFLAVVVADQAGRPIVLLNQY